jgi:malate dehydrogenase (oxaloacetate-decarboxylating)
VLDVRAQAITDGMAIAAARELAACVENAALGADRILPGLEEWQVAARVAAATAAAAQSEGLARLSCSQDEVLQGALRRIGDARHATAALMRDGWIAAPPPA